MHAYMVGWTNGHTHACKYKRTYKGVRERCAGTKVSSHARKQAGTHARTHARTHAHTHARLHARTRVLLFRMKANGSFGPHEAP